MQRRFEQRPAFTQRRFRAFLELVMDNIVQPAVATRQVALYLVAWETPPLSAAVLVTLLALAWHDMLGHAAALLLLAHAAFVLAYGAAGSHPAVQRWLADVLGRTRTPPARTLLERLRNFRTTLGNTQRRMAKFGTYAVQLRGLYTWRDPPRSRLFLAGLVAAAALLSAVPFRVLFALFVLHQFTRVLHSGASGRSGGGGRPSRGPFTLAIRRFWAGLPVPGPADPVYAHSAFFAQGRGQSQGGGGDGSGGGSVLGAQAIGTDPGLCCPGFDSTARFPPLDSRGSRRAEVPDTGGGGAAAVDG